MNEYDGNTAETPLTNAMSKEAGFPVRLLDGSLVSIVSKQPNADSGILTLYDADGNGYQQVPDVEEGIFALVDDAPEAPEESAEGRSDVPEQKARGEAEGHVSAEEQAVEEAAPQYGHWKD